MGHSDSFCEAKITLGVEVAEMGWDLSLQAQSRRALTMTSIWLRDDRGGIMGGVGENNRGCRSGQWTVENKKRYVKIMDLVLRFNLEGGS